MPNSKEISLDELFTLSDNQLLQHANTLYNEDNVNVNEFLTFKIIQNEGKLLSLQVDDNNKYILKDITEELNRLENTQIINGFVYQNSTPLAYTEDLGFIELENTAFTTDIISRLNINKIDESDKKMIQRCIKAKIIDNSNIENIEKFLTSHTLDDLKVLRSKIDLLSDKVADVENIEWDSYRVKLSNEEKNAIVAILNQDKYNTCKN